MNSLSRFLIIGISVAIAFSISPCSFSSNPEFDTQLGRLIQHNHSDKQDLIADSTEVWIDSGYAGAAETGTVAQPFKTVSHAIAYWTTVAKPAVVHFRPGTTYTETANLTLPDYPCVIHGNGATLNLTGTLTIPNPYFTRYDLFTTTTGGITYNNFTAGARCEIHGGKIEGSLTVNSYVVVTQCQLTGNTITVGATGQMVVSLCTPTSTFTSAGVLTLERVNLNTGKHTPLVSSTGGSLTVINCLLTNAYDGGCISISSGTATNQIANNVITVASGAPVAIASGSYAIYSKNYIYGGLNTGTGYMPVSPDLIGPSAMAIGSDATGDMYYRAATGLLTRIPVGTSGQVLKLNASLVPTWTTP